MKFFILVALAVIGLNANSKLYVCYNSKTVSSTTGNLAYLGCKRYHDSCASNGKLHFGKYPTSGKASGALNRCLKSSPKFVNNGKAKVSSTSISTQTATVTGLDPNGDGFLSLRKKPKQREIGKLYNGDKVEILSQSGKYYKVKDVKSGMIGYAHSNWIRKTSNSTTASTSTSQKKGTVHGLDPNGDGFLSVRSKPKGKKIGKLYNGDKVAILGQRGAWYKVRTSSGLVGWSHGDWVSVKDNSIISEDIYDLLFDSIKNRDIVSLDKLLNNYNLDIDYNDKKLLAPKNSIAKHSRGTPLYYAIALGYMDIVKILMNHNADINKNMIIYSKISSGKVYNDNYTPLIKALKDDLNNSIIENMIKLGANVKQNIKNNREESPLYHLGGYSHRDANIVRIFLAQGALVDYGDNANITPLSKFVSFIVDADKNITRFHKQYEAIKVLLDNGANPNAKANTIGGYTPMIIAASKSLKLIKLLEEFGGELDTIANNGDTMLHEVENLSVANYLISNGLKKYINFKNKNGDTPIISTFSSISDYKRKDVTKLLLDSGAHLPKGNNLLCKFNFWMMDNNHAGSYKESLSHIEYSINYAKLLIEHGADINCRDDEGRSIIDDTFKYINTDKLKAKVIYFLIKNGATYKKINNNAINEYFKAANSGDMRSLNKILRKDSYEYINSDIGAQCKEKDQQCVLKALRTGYGAVNYEILYKKNHSLSEESAMLWKTGYTFYILLTDSEPKIIELTQTKNGKLSLGGK